MKNIKIQFFQVFLEKDGEESEYSDPHSAPHAAWNEAFGRLCSHEESPERLKAAAILKVALNAKEELEPDGDPDDAMPLDGWFSYLETPVGKFILKREEINTGWEDGDAAGAHAPQDTPPAPAGGGFLKGCVSVMGWAFIAIIGLGILGGLVGD